MNKDFDPLAYIENAFLDKKKEPTPRKAETLDVDLPTIGDYIKNGEAKNGHAPAAVVDKAPAQPKGKFKKTTMSAPRPRRASQTRSAMPSVKPEIQQAWETLPHSIDFLMSYYDDSVTANYYRGEFKESRNDLIRRLLDPELTLEETSRLLGVCPATVRRYTNRKWLAHHRTQGGQRRFRLSDIVRFVDAHGRFPEK